MDVRVHARRDLREGTEMKWFTELVGILLCIQGVGGGLSAIL